MDIYDFRGAYKPTGGRVGVRTGGAGRKRCTKGKSCGATCITATKACWVDLGGEPGSNGGRNLHDATSKVRDIVKNRSGSVGNAQQGITPTPQPQPKPQSVSEPKKENRQETIDRVSKGVREWTNKSIPSSQFKDETAKEKFIKDKTREAVKNEIAPKSKIQEAQHERLRREFAPKNGQVISIGLNGKTDKEGSDAINSGLDIIRKGSADANTKVDNLMKALERNPIPLIGRDNSANPENANTRGKLGGLVALTSNLRGGRTAEQIINEVKTFSLDKSGAFAMMDSQIVVMSKDRTAKQPRVSAAQANRNLKQAKQANAANWRWSDGAGATYLHEVGHVMHGRAFAGKNHKDIERETAAQLKSLGIRSVSQYGRTNAMETTAELYAAYMMNGPQLKKIMPEAYNWMDTLVQKAYNYTR